ncbi:MAG: spore coat protein [Desulfocucumaceae bacterium]
MMKQSGMREAMEMFEMLRDSACMIDHYTDYISHCQDPQLRQILESQQRRMVEEYQHKVSVIQGHGLDVSNIPRFQSAVAAQQGSTAGMAGMQGTSGISGMQGAAGTTGMQGAAGMGGMQGAAGMGGMQGATGAGMFGNTNIQFGIQQPGQAQAQQQSTSRTLNDRTISQGALIFHKCGASRATTAALESAEPHLRNLAAASARTCMDMAYEMFQYMNQRGFYQMPEMPRNFVNHTQAAGAPGYPGMQHGYQTGAQGGIPGQLS